MANSAERMTTLGSEYQDLKSRQALSVLCAQIQLGKKIPEVQEK